MRRYRITASAERDLWSILARIHAASPAAADRMHQRFRQAFDELARFPHSGHVREELTALPYRFKAVGNYLVMYDPAGKPLPIARIFHAAMDVARELRFFEPEA